MNDGITWVILTDGSYIKIMFNTASGAELKTLRDGDFEHTSKIAYQMVTRKRALTMDPAGQGSVREEQVFFLKLLSEFLVAQLANNAWQKLVLVAPAEIIKMLLEQLPGPVTDRITAAVSEDMLALTQDKLQEKLIGKF
jgi:hypothetical protein